MVSATAVKDSVRVLVPKTKVFECRVFEKLESNGVGDAYRRALRFASRRNGFVASLPQLVDARLMADGSDFVWTNWFTANSEEDFGVTKQGSLVVAVTHGGGILSSTPNRVQRAYQEGLTNIYAARFTPKEWRGLLNGRLSNQVLTFEDFDNARNLPDRYTVVLDFNPTKDLPSGVQSVDSLRDNKLFIVRAGGRARANAILDKFLRVYNRTEYGNWHCLKETDPRVAQGRLLYLGYDCSDGFYGSYYLSSDGRFVAGVSAGGAQLVLPRGGERETKDLEGKVLSVKR